MHFLMIMNLLMTWIILRYFKVDLFYLEFFMTEPSKVSNKKILKTFKSVTITECWLQCKQTDDCKDIGTTADRNERTITCYLLTSEEKEFGNEYTFLEMNHIHSVTVSFFYVYEFLTYWKFFKHLSKLFRHSRPKVSMETKGVPFLLFIIVQNI